MPLFYKSNVPTIFFFFPGNIINGLKSSTASLQIQPRKQSDIVSVSVPRGWVQEIKLM
jgi:hypothetical protein